MTARFFVDTNIFVYARDAYDPVKQKIAAEVLQLLWESGAGRISVQVLTELFAVLTGKFGVADQIAEEELCTLVSWTPRAMDWELMAQALELRRHYRLSWWDCCIIAAAVLERCKAIFSEDLSGGGTYAGLVVINPFRSGFSLEKLRKELKV